MNIKSKKWMLIFEILWENETSEIRRVTIHKVTFHVSIEWKNINTQN